MSSNKAPTAENYSCSACGLKLSGPLAQHGHETDGSISGEGARPAKYIPQPLDHRLLSPDGRMACNGCDALYPPGQLYRDCYCLDCVEELDDERAEREAEQDEARRVAEFKMNRDLQNEK